MGVFLHLIYKYIYLTCGKLDVEMLPQVFCFVFSVCRRPEIDEIYCNATGRGTLHWSTTSGELETALTFCPKKGGLC